MGGVTIETPAVTQNDTELVERVRAGDAGAFGLLYDRYLSPVYRYICFRVGGRQEAEDITGTVFLRAWEALPRFRGRDCAFSTWLYRIAHNAVVDHYRSGRPLGSLDVEAAEAQLADVGSDPGASVEIEDLRAALAELPPEQRELLLLRFVDGLGHDEVAKVVGKSEGACRVIQHRALRALGRILGGGR